MPDKDATIRDLKQKVAAFIQERDWEQYHNPKDLSMSISIEAAELMELFQWKNAAEVEAARKDPKALEKVKEELADVITYSLALANTLEIDVSEAVEDKLRKNAEKYPVHKAKGSNKKYTEL